MALLGMLGAIGGPLGAALGLFIGSRSDIFELGGARHLKDRTRSEMHRLGEILQREAAQPMGVIYGHDANLMSQHQVLAIHYHEEGDSGILHFWDNNDGHKTRVATLDYTGDELQVRQERLLPSGGREPLATQPKPVKGFFCEDYVSEQPPLSLRRL